MYLYNCTCTADLTTRQNFTFIEKPFGEWKKQLTGNGKLCLHKVVITYALDHPRMRKHVVCTILLVSIDYSLNWAHLCGRVWVLKAVVCFWQLLVSCINNALKRKISNYLVVTDWDWMKYRPHFNRSFIHQTNGWICVKLPIFRLRAYRHIKTNTKDVITECGAPSECVCFSVFSEKFDLIDNWK